MTLPEIHIDCQYMSSSSEVAYEHEYKYMKEKRKMRKISLSSTEESLELFTATFFPAILLSAMIPGTKQSPWQLEILESEWIRLKCSVFLNGLNYKIFYL